MRTTFTIDSENTITALNAGEQPAAGAQTFTTAKELERLAADWPAGRLAEIWNDFAGTPPFGALRQVKRFENRHVGAVRIWAAIQALAARQETADVAARAADVAPEPAQEGNRIAPELTGADTPSKKSTARAAKPPQADKPAREPRKDTRREQVIAMLRTKSGATLAEIAKATSWQAHTIRGFISGSLGTKMGLKVESFKNPSGERTYRLPA